MFEKYVKYFGLCMNIVSDVMTKLADGILTPDEIVDGIENGVRAALPEIREKELQGLAAITSAEEYKNFIFQDGDVAFVIPAELTERLKIDLF